MMLSVMLSMMSLWSMISSLVLDTISRHHTTSQILEYGSFDPAVRQQLQQRLI